MLERKHLPQDLLAHAPPRLAFSTHTIGNGDAAFRMASVQKLEGIICKRVDSPYRAGRDDDWLKVKRLESDEFAVVSYTPPKGSRSGFGSLLLARPDPDVAAGWIYAGRVGTGFTDDQLQELGTQLNGRGHNKPPVKLTGINPLLHDAHWIKPSAVVDVFYRGIGNKKLLRQPSLKTMRSDKTVADLSDSDCTPASIPGKGRPSSCKSPAGSSRASIKITHPERVVFPEDGYTKQDMADYIASCSISIPGPTSPGRA